MSIKRAVIVLCILFFILAAVLIGCSKDKVVKVSLQDEILCNTRSVTTTADDANLISVSVPANSSITKIRATFRVDGVAPDPDWAHLLITSNEQGVGERIFETDFAIDPDVSVGVYETDFIHPLFLGSEGGSVSMGTAFAIPADLSIAVVYCPQETEE